MDLHSTLKAGRATPRQALRWTLVSFQVALCTLLLAAAGLLISTFRFACRGPTAPVPAQRCRDRAVEVEWFLPENRGRRNSDASYCGRRPERYQELSAIDIRISLPVTLTTEDFPRVGRRKRP